MTKTPRIDPARLAFLEQRKEDASGAEFKSYQRMVELQRKRSNLRTRIRALEESRPGTVTGAATRKKEMDEARAQLAEIETEASEAQEIYEDNQQKATIANSLLDRCREYAAGGSRA